MTGRLALTNLSPQSRKKARNEKKWVHWLVSPHTLYDFRLMVVKGRRSKKMEIQIGDQAPDFRAQAYHRGAIKTLRLSQYRKQWVVLLFYPADFTSV
jgi:peroxiredoxin (alkyl hydroperoxide reductase subunit C)